MRAYLWFPVLTSLSLGFTFMNIPPLGPQFMELMGVGFDGLSILLSGLFWSHALLQLPSGLIADRWNPWNLLVGGLGICLLGNLLPFIKPDSLVLATVWRALVGVGTSVSFLAMMKVILILAPPEKIPQVQGVQGAGFSFGFALPYFILPILADGYWGWSYLTSALAVTLALGACFFLPRAKLRPAPNPRPAAEVRRAVLAILTSRPIWFLGIFHGLSYGSLNNLGNWLPSILADMNPARGADIWAPAAMALLLIGSCGRAFGGRLSAWLRRDRLVNGAILAIAVLYMLMGLAGSQFSMLGSAFLMALACGFTYGGIFSLSASAGGAYAATGMGVMNMVGNLFNVLLTLFFGYVRQHTGDFAPSLIATGILAGAVWFLGRRLVAGVEAQSRAGQ